jgi:hypothetical protein
VSDRLKKKESTMIGKYESETVTETTTTSRQARKPAGWHRALKGCAAALVLALSVGLAEAAVVGDFTIIRGDDPKRIGDGAAVWEVNFNTGGRRAASPAYLILNVKGLNVAVVPVEVRVNNLVVGYIYPSPGASAETWQTQMIALQGDTLNDGDNELELRAVSYPGAIPADLYDDYYVKLVICHFHQSV